jgi:xylan 1,4-beta-xylosidase
MPTRDTIEMGSPATLTPAQLEELHGLARDVPEIERTVEIDRDGRLSLPVAMNTNDVVLALLEPIAE